MDTPETLEVEPMMAIADAIAVPVDLTDWADKRVLRRWAVEHVDSYNWSNPELLALLRQHENFEARQLFSTLILAYSTGKFGAEDVLNACSGDPEYRTIRPRLLPRLADFTNFRKFNRALLKAGLFHVITQALKSQIVEGQEIEHLPPGLRRLCLENASERLEIARHMDRTGG